MTESGKNTEMEMFYQFRKNSEAITVNIFVLAKITFKTQIRVWKCRWGPTSRWAWQWTLSILSTTYFTNQLISQSSPDPTHPSVDDKTCYLRPRHLSSCQEPSHWPQLTTILPSFILQLAVHWCDWETFHHSWLVFSVKSISVISHLNLSPLLLSLCQGSESLNENQP